jgi:hypothetical protein
VYLENVSIKHPVVLALLQSTIAWDFVKRPWKVKNFWCSGFRQLTCANFTDRLYHKIGMLHLHGCVKSFILIFFCSSHTLEPLSISSFHNHPMFLRICTKSTCPPLISMMNDGALQEKPECQNLHFMMALNCQLYCSMVPTQQLL